MNIWYYKMIINIPELKRHDSLPVISYSLYYTRMYLLLSIIYTMLKGLADWSINAHPKSLNGLCWKLVHNSITQIAIMMYVIC